jgi:hypothetical protein
VLREYTADRSDAEVVTLLLLSERKGLGPVEELTACWN